MTTNLKSALPVILTLVVIGLVAGGSLASFNRAQTMNNFQGCLQLATGKTITEGTTEGSKWTVEQPQINDTVFQTCVSKKGL